MTNDELIAEFDPRMVKYVPENNKYKPYYKRYKDQYRTRLVSEHAIDDLEYSTSWNWLMPVVELISKQTDITLQWHDDYCTFYINKQNLEGTEITSRGGLTAIENVYTCVLEYIKYYNKTKI